MACVGGGWQVEARVDVGRRLLRSIGWGRPVVARVDVDALLDYRARAPHAVRAHPTEEHFLPIFFALGAAGWGSDAAVAPDYLTREIMYRYLAMDAFALA